MTEMKKRAMTEAMTAKTKSNSIEQRTASREAMLRKMQANQRRLAKPDDYVYDKSQEKFWDIVTCTIHSDKAVDASIPLEYWRVVIDEADEKHHGVGRPKQRKERLIPPSKDILRVESNQFVEGSTWWPGKPRIVEDYLINAEGLIRKKGCRLYNQYTAPERGEGDPLKASPWVDHIKRLWPKPQESEYFLNYCAHMIQRPHEKCNAAIVLSGAQGIGKDAALYPVKTAIGVSNYKNINPDELFSNFQPWKQTVMLIVDEARPGRDDHYATSIYNILKPMIAAPPDTLPVNDKFVKLRYVINVMRVFITTNNWQSLYIPEDDRRMFILHSNLPQKWNEIEGLSDYFVDLFEWFEDGGCDHVAAYLMNRDISKFKPKAHPPRTDHWQTIAAAWGSPEDAIEQALEKLGNPPIVFASELLSVQFDGTDEIEALVRNTRRMQHRMQLDGYTAVSNSNGKKWDFEGDRRIRGKFAYVKLESMSGKSIQLEIVKHGRKAARRSAGGAKDE